MRVSPVLLAIIAISLIYVAEGGIKKIKGYKFISREKVKDSAACDALCKKTATCTKNLWRRRVKKCDLYATDPTSDNKTNGGKDNGGKDNGGKNNGGKDNGGKNKGGKDNGGKNGGSTGGNTAPVVPATPIGFDPVNRGVLDTAQQWTMVQRTGFPSAGKLLGFKFYNAYPTSQRAITLGLYRPTGTCSFTVLKTWSLNVASSGSAASLNLEGADQIVFNSGDTIGLTWHNYGNIPFDYTGGAQNYCEDAVLAPASGSLNLVADRHGSRIYSLQAVWTTDTKSSSSGGKDSGKTGGNTAPVVPATPIGFDPVNRGVLDTAGLWTMVQRQGFPSAGKLLGFKIYNAYPTSQRAITLGLYRPTGTCSFTVLKTWSLNVASSGSAATVNLEGADQIVFNSGDTIGLTWHNYGNIPFDYVSTQNYCEDAVATPSSGSFNLVADRYGSRVYSLQAVWTTDTKSSSSGGKDSGKTGGSTAPVVPATPIGFDPVNRGVLDTAGLWTMIQRQGFPSNGKLLGFKIYNAYPTSQRAITLGLYRPTGTCTFTVLKTWSLNVASSGGAATINLEGADQIAFNAGDTIGLTWHNYGNIPFDYVSAQNYCEDAIATPSSGSVTLVANRYGSRVYSLQALWTAK